jgi:5S rRNA maturation endonuclease (ribonuclease M5)
VRAYFGSRGYSDDDADIRRMKLGAIPELSTLKNLKNLNREAGILNIPRDATEIIIMEGVLDALLAKARGIRNAVSLNGCGLNEAQCDMLAENGIKRVILLLDNDDAGQDATLRITQRLLAHAHPFEVYIAQMPQGFKETLRSFYCSIMCNPCWKKSIMPLVWENILQPSSSSNIPSVTNHVHSLPCSAQGCWKQLSFSERN